METLELSETQYGSGTVPSPNLSELRILLVKMKSLGIFFNNPRDSKTGVSILRS